MGFLGKARKMMAGKGAVEPPRPQYYQVSCAEGHVIRGERTEGYQALRCPHCGDGVFVLPRSPLPLPPAPASSRPKARPAAVAASFEDQPIELTEAPPQIEDLDEIQWLEPEPLVKSAPPPRPSRRPRPRPEPELEPVENEARVEVPTEAEEAPPPPIPTKKRPARPRPAALQEPEPELEPPRPAQAAAPGMVALPPRRRRQNRVGMILVGAVVLVAATVGYRLYNQRRQELPHIAEVNATEGLAALERGQFDEAKKKLKIAADAYRELKATDEVATTTIQSAKEAAILADLAQYTLKEIVEEIARLGDPDGPARFKTFYKDRSILIDCAVRDIRGGVIDLDYRILIGRGPAPAKIGRLDLEGFTLFPPGTVKKGQHLLFGAQLGSIRLQDGEWLVTLAPDSGVNMTNARALAIGLNGTAEDAP